MATAWQTHGNGMANARQLHSNCVATAWPTHGNCLEGEGGRASAWGAFGGGPSPSMAPWLSRAEREASGRAATRKINSLRSGDLSLASSASRLAISRRHGKRSPQTCGILSGASSPRPKRRRLSDEVERTGASTPRPKRRRRNGQVQRSGASSPRPKRRRLSDQVASSGASSPRPKRRRLCDAVESIDDLVGPASETRKAHLLRHGGGRRTCPRCSCGL